MSIRTSFNPLGTLGNIEILDSVFVPRLISKDAYVVAQKTIDAPSTNNYRSVVKFRDFTCSSSERGVLGTANYQASQLSGFFFYAKVSTQLWLVQTAKELYRFSYDRKRIECTQIGREIKLYLDGALEKSFNIPAWPNHTNNVNVRQNKFCSYTFERIYVADGEQILVDFVPARCSDGVLGIFDKVTRSFYEFSS